MGESLGAAVRIGLVSMTKKPHKFEHWLEYHRRVLSIERFYIRVEDTPELGELLRTPPWDALVTATFSGRTERDFWEFHERQEAHIASAIPLARKAGLTHLLHIDDDELVYTPRGLDALRREMALADPSRLDVHMANIEALLPAPDCENPFLEARAFRHFPDEYGSHFHGKSFGALHAPQLAPAGSHRFRGASAIGGGGSRATHVLSPHIACVLHYESATFAQWRTKYLDMAMQHSNASRKLPFKFYRESLAAALELLRAADEASRRAAEEVALRLWSRWKLAPAGLPEPQNAPLVLEGGITVLDPMLAPDLLHEGARAIQATPSSGAVEQGRTEAVKHKVLLQEDAAAASGGATPLSIAAQKGHIEVVRVLLLGGARVRQAKPNGATPLFFASEEGHTEIVKILLQEGARTDQAMSDGVTPLMVASREGHTEVVKILCQGGARVNQANADHIVSLFFASEEGHTETVKVLLQLGARVDMARSDGRSPLIIAAGNGHTEVVKLLCQRGAAAFGGATSLMIASGEGNTEMVRVLLQGGARVEQAAHNGATPLLIAIEKGHAEVVEALCQGGARVNEARSDGVMPLYIASQLGHAGVVKVLLQKGARADLARHNGFTPLYIASKNGHTEVAKVLLEGVGARVNEAAANGFTPLYISSEKGHAEVVEVLCQGGARVNEAASNGATSLYIASQQGHTEVVEVLTSCGARVDQANSGGVTPLLVASYAGHVGVVKTLLQEGARADQAAPDGTTPQLIAGQMGHVEVVKVLTQASTSG